MVSGMTLSSSVDLYHPPSSDAFSGDRLLEPELFIAPTEADGLLQADRR
jgi:hypothetical protein